MPQLRDIEYGDRVRALREISQLTRALPRETAGDLDSLLAASPAPEQGLHYFSRLREENPDAFAKLAGSQMCLRGLVAVFTHSHFLSEAVIRRPEWMLEIFEDGWPERARTVEEYAALLESTLTAGLPSALELARFRRQHMLRILLRDLLKLASLPVLTGELTALADALLDAAYWRISEHLQVVHGTPYGSLGEQATFAAIALGKMGGEELNYSSDIDLMFLYSANGETRGPRSISNKEFFGRVAHQLTELLSTPTPEGRCYRVDLRLRPDGNSGEVCLSIEGTSHYYQQRAAAWELQMLIKARPAGGDKALGKALLDFVEPGIYSSSLDFAAIEQLAVSRERLTESLSKFPKLRSEAGLHLKLEPGGIRDIEFLVQCMQRLHGGEDTWVRHGGTMLALARLHDKGHISDSEFGRLAGAYQFFRNLEHRLQFADDRQLHVLPANRDELEFLARSMDGEGSEWLLAQVHTHLSNVREIYDLLIHSKTAPETPTVYAPKAGLALQGLELRAPQLAAAVTGARIRRGQRALEHFLSRTPADVESLLNGNPELTRDLLLLIEDSPHFAEELIRAPQFAIEIALAQEPFGDAPSSADELRRWYRRMMLRVQAASVCQSQPVFDSLERTSLLAEIVIQRVYTIAVQQILATHPPSQASYTPMGQMWVVALGRLGMGEFDIASDADLVFVLADGDATELEFWTRVAQRFVDMIMAYTGEGVLFAVDTRLRPNGNDGLLVMCEGPFIEYFHNSAEAWEGITYLKARIVAGDAKRGAGFLHQLQGIDWQRHGQRNLSRVDLRTMRGRIEKEQGAAHPLKAGRGGFYDIDFILMYLRLKAAGMYYDVLNTPERIKVLESNGQLDRGSAKFLLEAATFYRALDHAIRVMTGHAQDRLPQGVMQVENLAALLKRWTPIGLDQVETIQSNVRTLYEKIFH